MGELTIEQQRARARAQARLRLAQQAQPAASPAPEAPSQSVGGGMLDAFTQGAALGFGDELTGLEAAILGRTPEGGFFDYSRPFGERYERAVAAERGQQDAFADAAPVASGVAKVAGALGTGLAAGGAGLTLMRPGASIASNAGRAAVEGAAYGAAAGAGEADEGSRMEGAAMGAGLGAAFGGATAGALGMVGRIGSAQRAAARAPSVAQLKAQGGAALDRAAAANPTFDGFDDYVIQAYRYLDDPRNGYDAGAEDFSGIARWVNQLEELSTGGTAPTYQQLSMLLGRLKGPAENFGKPSQQRLAITLRKALDAYMEQAAARASNPGNLPATAGQSATSPQAQAMADVRDGRALWARAKKAEKIDDAVLRAERRAASTGSGGNVENAIRQNIRGILDNPRKRQGFTRDEIAAMEKIVRGEPVQNFARLVGKLSPSGNGLMAAITGMGGAGMAGVTMNPLFLAPAGVGMVAKALADRTTQSQAANLSALVRSGGATAMVPPTGRLSPAAQAVARALAAQAGGVMAP